MLFRYFCIKIPHKQNFIILTIRIKNLIKVIEKISLWDGRWYFPQSSYLHFLKLSSTKILSKTVLGMKIIIPPPFLFLSNLYGLEKLFIKNRDSKQRFQKRFIKFCFSYNKNVYILQHSFFQLLKFISSRINI